jgi:choline dehydrogenase-like flavoprotein
VTDAARRTLDALCRRIVPAAYEGAGALDIVAEIERRMHGLDPATERQLDRLLRFLATRIGAWLLTGSAVAIPTQTAAQLDATLDRWQRSPRPSRRAAWQALRRLVLASYYTTPAAHAAIGYLGPPHRRLPRYAWEGPPVGEPSAAEPIARVATASDRLAVFDDFAPPPPMPDALLRAISRGRDISGERVVRCDVCVVGSGAGGAVVAARLAAAGRDVVIIEEGPFVSYAEMNEDEATMTAMLYADGGARTTNDLSFTLLQGRNVGGGGTINWMIMLRPRPWVMDEWQREHGTTLLGENELVPALDRIERETGARLVPEDAHAPANRVILDGAARLGWQATPAAINADGCIRAGICGLGCRYGAKRGALGVHLPAAAAHGARIFDDTRVARILIGRNGAGRTRKRVAARTLDRQSRRLPCRLTIEAATVVLAAGAVGTPSILQRSGLGGGGVGRFLRLHPTTAVFAEYDRAMQAGPGIPQSALCTEFLHGDDGYGFWIESPSITPGLAAAAIQGFGAAHRSLMVGSERQAALIVLVRDGAARGASQGEVVARRGGAVTIRYRLGAHERRRLAEGLRAAARLHFAAGARAATTLHVGAPRMRTVDDIEAAVALGFEPNLISLFSAHVNGTCRIGTDPATSGCTPDGERHGARDVFVADGSLLPTAPGINPHATIMAAASLVAARILAKP